ncbi:hypothetical protein EAG_06311 [Camponotus floridanus]|uniref:Uncharacterized protein n=1 Tax=Camponotus floridanus TaxID=104421 RepID=E2AHK9_CAMFO|nr:hypothetical protein EAG_06311 [Camponotus floridanus]
MARDILSSIASSVPVERLFSIGTLTMFHNDAPRSAKLPPDRGMLATAEPREVRRLLCIRADVAFCESNSSRYEKSPNSLDSHERVEKSGFLIRHAFCASIRLYRCISPAAMTRRHPSKFTLGSLGPSLSPFLPTFPLLLPRVLRLSGSSTALNDSLTENDSFSSQVRAVTVLRINVAFRILAEHLTMWFVKIRFTALLTHRKAYGLPDKETRRGGTRMPTRLRLRRCGGTDKKLLINSRQDDTRRDFCYQYSLKTKTRLEMKFLKIFNINIIMGKIDINILVFLRTNNLDKTNNLDSLSLALTEPTAVNNPVLLIVSPIGKQMSSILIKCPRLNESARRNYIFLNILVLSFSFPNDLGNPPLTADSLSLGQPFLQKNEGNYTDSNIEFMGGVLNLGTFESDPSPRLKSHADEITISTQIREACVSLVYGFPVSISLSVVPSDVDDFLIKLKRDIPRFFSANLTAGNLSRKLGRKPKPFNLKRTRITCYSGRSLAPSAPFFLSSHFDALHIRSTPARFALLPFVAPRYALSRFSFSGEEDDPERERASRQARR